MYRAKVVPWRIKNSSIAKGSEDQAEIDVLCCFKSLEERRIREARKLMQMKLADASS